MRLGVAALLLKLPLPPGSPRAATALDTALRAADRGDPAGVRAVARAFATQGADSVWRAWLKPSVSGSSPRRWTTLLQRLSTAAGTTGGPGGGPVPVSDHLVNTAWSEWLVQHDAVLWSLLKHWARASTDSAPRQRALSRLALGHDDVTLDSATLTDAALRFDHPLGERARARLLALGDPEAVDLFCAAALDAPEAAAFCAAHRLAPSDDVRRAVFFLRTGQYEQYRAQDPDGAQLALGYRGATAAVRSALRAAMTSLGDVDMLRVLAGQRHDRQDVASLSAQERSFLVQQLVDRGDWPKLWRLVPLLSLTEAVRSVRAFGKWRPSDDDDLRLFTVLREADEPWRVGAGLKALSKVWASSLTPIPVELGASLNPGFVVDDLDFSPDGSELAFAGHVGRRCYAGAVDVGSQKIARVYGNFRYRRVAHLGAGTVLAAEEAERHAAELPGAMPGTRNLHHFDGKGVHTAIPFEAAHIHGLQRIAGDQGFVVTAQGASPGEGSAYGVFVGAGHGPLAETAVLNRTERFFPWCTVADPSGRLVAVLGPHHAVIADLADGTVHPLDGGPPGGVTGRPLAALAPHALVRVTRHGHLNIWDDPRTAAGPPTTAHVWSTAAVPEALAFSPFLNRFVAVSCGHLELLSLPPVPDGRGPQDLVAQQIGLPGSEGKVSCARLSPKGDVLAVATTHSAAVQLYHLAPALTALTEPMGLMSREQLTELSSPPPDPKSLGDHASQHARKLLLACLRYRFRHDIGIGSGVGDSSGNATHTASGCDYDIELEG